MRALVDSISDRRDDREEIGFIPARCEVIYLLFFFFLMKSIGRILKITPRTVAFHKYGMMEQLGIKSMPSSVEFAIKQHVVTV